MYVLVTCIILHHGNSAQVRNTMLSISGDVDSEVCHPRCVFKLYPPNPTPTQPERSTPSYLQIH